MKKSFLTTLLIILSLLISSESSEQTIADCQNSNSIDECLEQNSEAKSNYDNLYSPTNPPTVQGSENDATRVYYGYNACINAACGAYSTAIGYEALREGGDYSTGVGYRALYSAQSSATDNTAVGFEALFSNTTGSSNIAIGNALYSNTT